MDLASFIVNTLNKIEPTSETSLSVLKVGISNHFNEQEKIMEDYNEKKKLNFDIEKEIEKVDLGLPEQEYNQQVQRLRNTKVDLPKVGLFTKVIAFCSKPMARLVLYVLFIAVSSYITKRLLNKGDDSEEDSDDEEDFRPSKKERKILKKYKNYDKDIR